MKMTGRDRWDWSLLIFIVPIGILLMMIAGWIAMRVVPQWRLQAGMGSTLKIDAGNNLASDPRPPMNPQILTPFAWLGTYLTPSGGDVFFAPFVVIQPSATPSPTRLSTTTETPATPVTVSPSVTVVTTPPATVVTSKPPDDDGTPVATPATPSPSPTTPSPSPTTPSPSPTTPSPSTPVVSTLNPSLMVTPFPSAISVGSPDGVTSTIPQGSYTVIYLGNTPIIVMGPSETNYDLVYYESQHYSSGNIHFDSVVLGISEQADGSVYYEVFNWGNDNNTPETHTNVDVGSLPPDPSSSCTEAECDNRVIPMSVLYPNPGTGILIDVDNAPSAPPLGTYHYVVIIGPINPSPDTIQVDSIEVVDVPRLVVPP